MSAIPCLGVRIDIPDGTTGLVALKHGRRYVGCDVNVDYLAMTVERLGLANEPAEPADEEPEEFDAQEA